MSFSAAAEGIKLAVTRRCSKQAPQFQIVPDKAQMLFDNTAEKHSKDLRKINGFWEKAAYLKERVLARTTKRLRGNMARLYHEYTAAMLRGELASMDDDTVMRQVDPNIEKIAQGHAWLACTAGLN
jgi:hypothetical protein